MNKIPYLSPELALTEVEELNILCTSPKNGSNEDIGYEEWSD